ncbi:hypothetical protein L226DRAFT_532967 [Lentinus tigrinus ALCF2SS1-7]|uniref:uncharacterized protein n=1 Tax=Lentinus tigrinus ALCF2SS1-7 TaxID=1328758 RepID=UPI001165EFE5|nr:hypothetical protein L226DRAFT_532967 [Lentinus tigrinus ALCF2SS1-7]
MAYRRREREDKGPKTPMYQLLGWHGQMPLSSSSTPPTPNLQSTPHISRLEIKMLPVSAFPSLAGHRAMMCYDVLCSTFDALQNGIVEDTQEAALCRATLASCAVVCRPWSQPALRRLWNKLPSLLPLLHIFTPDDMHFFPFEDLISDSILGWVPILAVELYRNAPSSCWDRLAFYSRFVHGCAWEGHSTASLTLLALVLGLNPQRTFLPHLETLAWTPSEKRDALFVTLSGRKLRELVLYYSLCDVDDECLQPILERLQTSSPRLTSIRIDGPLPFVGADLCHIIASFRYLREIDLAFQVDISSFMTLVSSSRITSIKIGNVFGTAVEDAQVLRCPELHTLAVSGDSSCLTYLLGLLRMPSLRLAHLVIRERSPAPGTSDKVATPDYASCIAALAAAASPGVHLEWLNISIGRSNDLPTMPACRTVLIDLIGPLLPFARLRHFELLHMDRDICVQFAASNSDLEVMTKAWMELEYLSLDSLTWHLDDAGFYHIPSIAALYHFWHNCPNLHELRLPYLDLLHDDPTELPMPTVQESKHPLTTLRVDAGMWKKGRVELCYEEGQHISFAKYLMRLFPRLDRQDCCQHVGEMGLKWAQAGWGRVFLWLCERESLKKVLRERQSSSGMRPHPIDPGLWDGFRIYVPGRRWIAGV